LRDRITERIAFAISGDEIGWTSPGKEVAVEYAAATRGEPAWNTSRPCRCQSSASARRHRATINPPNGLGVGLISGEEVGGTFAPTIASSRYTSREVVLGPVDEAGDRGLARLDFVTLVFL